MKPLAFAALLLLSAGAHANETLTETERLTLIDQLDSLKTEARTRVLGRFEGATAAYTTGMGSEEAAIDLYLKCVEKVDFTDKDRKSSDFRDWKKRNKDRLDDEAYALALRHQLRWTLLTMRAAADREKTHQLADELLETLESIYLAPEELRPHLNVLSTSVTNTAFTRAYELSGYKVPNWPMSPITGGGGRDPKVKVQAPFDLVIFPALRQKQDYPALRAAWDKRIRYEEITTGFWSPGSRDAENGDTLEHEKFLSETQPDLIWQMEEDLFKAGDQKAAALKMLEHLRDNISHTNARDWEARFRELVDPQAGPGTPPGA